MFHFHTHHPLLKPLVIGVLGIGAVLFALGGTSKAAEASAPVPPKDVLARINAALASADPHTIRIAASQVEAAGFPIQADSMRRAAAEIEATIRAAAEVKPGDKSVPLASAPVTGSPIKNQADQDARTFAGKVALMLTQRGKGREDKAMVKTYQVQETNRNQPVGKADGLYGAKTALSLAVDHGIVPPKPFYWPNTAQAAAKEAYSAVLLGIANKDVSRAEEWKQAAKV